MASQIMMMSRWALAAIAASLLTTTACTPVVTQRGWIQNEQQISQVKIGEADRTAVREALGTPSSAAAFAPETWFYISSEEEQVAFLDPEIRKRDILAVEFDDNGVVRDMRRYTIQDGKLFAFNDEQTPTRGRELTLLQQLFGNVRPGGLPGAEEEAGGGRPGGGTR